jgi:ATP-binding cassette subfamily B protein
MIYFKRYNPGITISSAFVLSGLSALILRIVGPFLTALIADVAFKGKSTPVLIFILTCGLIIFLFELLATFINDYINVQILAIVSGRIAHEINQKTLQTDIYEGSKIKSIDCFVRMNTDSIWSAELINRMFYSTTIDLTRFFGFLIAIGSIDQVTAVLVSAGVPVYLFKSWFYSQYSTEIQKRREVADIDFTEKTVESLHNLRVIKAYGAEALEHSKFANLWRLRSVSNRSLRVLNLFSSITTFSTIRLIQTIIVGLAGYKVISSRLSIGEFFAMASLLPMIEEPIRRLSTLYADFQVGLVSLNRVDDVLNVGLGTISAKETASEQGQSVDQLVYGEITLKNVTVSYSHQFKAIDNVSLRIKSASSVAIVGPIGAGKTTLMNLILGLQKPNNGKIEIDGINICNYKNSVIRQKIAVIDGEMSVFSGSVFDNIAYNNRDLSESDVIVAASLASAHEAIMLLPSGYNTIIDPQEGKISSGLLQKISIARALALKPRVLVLDDSLSALDLEGRLAFRLTLEKLKKSMTVVMFSNQFEGVHGFDQIIVLDSGSIVESGSFSELKAKRSVFARLHYMETNGFSHFRQRMELELERSNRYQQPLTILVMELIDNLGAPFSKGGSDIKGVMKELDYLVRQEIRTMDFCSVFLETKIIIALPSTDVQGAETCLRRLQVVFAGKQLNTHSGFISVKLSFKIFETNHSNLEDSNSIYMKISTEMDLEELRRKIA